MIQNSVPDMGRPAPKNSDPHLEECELSIVMPCLNEAATLAACIAKSWAFLESHQIVGEVIVADNGSIDGSREIASAQGARVITVPTRGYGAALMGGIEAARGRYVIIGDADDSYDFTSLLPFVSKLREGYDLVMGNRFSGGIMPHAMPFLHRFLGNPVLTALGRLFFGSPVGDFHCGLRGFRTSAVQNLNLQTTGMEFASEMVVKATLHGLRVTEVPTVLFPAGRSRPPHLRTWRDGWRHLRFLLIYSPRWLFLYPGIAFVVLGLFVGGLLLIHPLNVAGVTFDINTMLYAAVAILLGIQMVSFAVFSKVFAIRAGLLPRDERLGKKLAVFSLERGLFTGGALTLVGIGGSVYAVLSWFAHSLGPLDPSSAMRITIPSLTCLAAGIQTIFNSFFLSLLQVEHK